MARALSIVDRILEIWIRAFALRQVGTLLVLGGIARLRRSAGWGLLIAGYNERASARERCD